MFNTPNDLRLPGTEDWYLIISLPNLWDLQLLLKKKGGGHKNFELHKWTWDSNI